MEYYVTISVCIASMLLVGAWIADRWLLGCQIKARDRQIGELHRLLLLAKLSGVVSERHQFVGMQQLSKMQYTMHDGSEGEVGPPIKDEPEPEGRVIRGSFAQ